MLELLRIFTSDLLFTLIVPGIFAGLMLIMSAWFLPKIFAEYKIPAAILGLFLVLFFTFQSGRYQEVSKAEILINKQKAEIAVLQAKSSEVTIKTVVEYVDRIKYVDRLKEVPIEIYVTPKADSQCIIDDTTDRSIRVLYAASIKGIVP